MNSKRTFFVMSATLGLLIIGLFVVTYFINGLLVGQANNVKANRLEAETLDAQSTALAAAKKDVIKYNDLSTIAKSIVPEDKDQAQTVREIVNIGAKSGVVIGSITFPTSSLGLTGAAAGGSSSARSQLSPVKGIAGVFYLPITVQSDPNKPVGYNNLIAFLEGLEHNRRTALLSAITLTPDSKDSNNVGFNITLDEYIKP